MNCEIIGVVVKDHIENTVIERYLKQGETLDQLLDDIENDVFQTIVRFIYLDKLPN